MSALNLLSIIAPVVASVPQGSSGKAESGFQNLMAAMSDEEVAAPEARTGAAETATPETATSDPKAAAGFIVAPAPAPQTLPPAVGSSAESEGNASTNRNGKVDADPATLPPAPGVADEAPDGPNTFPPAPADKNLAPKTNEPQVQPAVSDVRSFRDQVRENRPAQAATAATTKPVEASAPVQSQAHATAALAPSAPPPVAPPPMRPLAERTSRPTEAPAGKAGDGPRMTDPAPAVPATASAAAPMPTAQATSSADFSATAAAAARALADGKEAEAPTSDRAPPGEAEVVQTQSTATARETALSQLSRVTIEATAQIAAQILRRLEGRSTRFEMALTPDELGRVDVKLDIDSEGRLNARLAFDNPAAATDLRGRADELRRQLEDAGFHLSEDAFEFAERDSGSSAFDRGQNSRNGPSRAFAAASRLNTEIDVDQPPGWLKLSLSPSGVDMKV